MQIKEIAELLEIIEKSAIEEFELERSGVRIRVRKSAPAPALQASTALAAPVTTSAVTVVSEPEEQPVDESIYQFKAPIVGTFYLTPKPDAEPFVRVGDRVTKGTVICIIEAMKIFNQIECDADGEITRIRAENGQPVEYGQTLFDIRLDS